MKKVMIKLRALRYLNINQFNGLLSDNDKKPYFEQAEIKKNFEEEIIKWQRDVLNVKNPTRKQFR